MSRQQWYNLWRSYRWMRRQVGHLTAVHWVRYYNPSDGVILQNVVENRSPSFYLAACRRVLFFSRGCHG